MIAQAFRLWLQEVLVMAVKARRFRTGTKSWTSSRESADGKAVFIEVHTETGTKTMSVRKEPLQLVPGSRVTATD